MNTLLTIVLTITIIILFTLLLTHLHTIEKLRIYAEDGVVFMSKKEPNIKCVITNIEALLNDNEITILIKYPTGKSSHHHISLNEFFEEWQEATR